ncbi:hypothetical protein FN846DRAFT_904784 [Sphaerosporella brunnea]|uniref:Uncharacterized protein n=1 Tax=Sphaerosporella brunnea TaxID=1250544 RepID=A0A5J5F319_9PEZI|nr:hypothetical protein FN846DRAFT_904784 [Sphaerosporella brunnea]
MKLYSDAILACATDGTVETEASKLLDWRYFFVDTEGLGHCTCGFAQLVAKGLLKTVVNIHDFLDPVWEKPLRYWDSMSSTSVSDFFLLFSSVRRWGVVDAKSLMDEGVGGYGGGGWVVVRSCKL